MSQEPHRPLLTLDLGGEVFEFRGRDERWREALAYRFAAFERLEPACDPFTVTLEATGGSPDDHALNALLEEQAIAGGQGGRLTMTAPSYRLDVDLEHRRGAVSAPLHRIPVDMLLRMALPSLLAPEGLLVHGALLTAEGRGWLCSGPSGAGKSTLAGLLPKQAVCDELAVVRHAARGWETSSLPYWNGRPATASLAGIHLLHHAAANVRTRLAPAAALRRLGPEIRWPHGEEASAAALRTLAELVEAVPVWDLAFRPSADVWEVICAPVAQEAT